MPSARISGIAIISSGLLATTTLAAPTAAPTHIEIISSRPDMVTGGSALVAITLPEGGSTKQVKVKLGNKDVTGQFRVDGDRLLGIVSGLKPGKNALGMRAGKIREEVLIVNHDSNGPIISGAQQQPFVCQTDQFRMPDGKTLGPALDTHCNIATRVDYVYKSADTGAFKPFDPSAPRPGDIASTVTTEGHSVPFIVRIQTGTLNRAIYQHAVLFDPAAEQAPSPFTSYQGWNRRIVYEFGGSASAGYQQGKGLGALMSILDEDKLARGFAVLGSTLNVLGQASNDVLSAETASMVKEAFIETFGEPLYTMGWGGSGGSMSQHLVANNYPGLLDGINPAAAFADLHSVVPTAVDCALLDRAFKAGGSEWSDDQKAAVSGYGTFGVCSGWNSTFSPHWMRPDQMTNEIFRIGDREFDTSNCSRAVPKELTYDRQRNTGGARCDIYSGIRNLIGIDPATGAAARAFDNVGVQYGLAAWRSGAISGEQFVRLNETIGGFGAEGEYQAARTVANRQALEKMYGYGRIVEGENLDIPIIDLRSEPFRNPDVHDSVRSISMRARLVRANGTSDNQIILRSDAPPTAAGSGGTSGAPKMDVYALLKMDEWLTAMKADTRTYPDMMAKTLANKPAGLSDACFLQDGTRIDETAAIGATGQCGKLMPYYSNPRMVAGEPVTDDVLKCALRPFDRADFSGLSGEQIARLEKVFSSGVCDYAKPPEGFTPLAGNWLSYPEPGKAVPLK